MNDFTFANVWVLENHVLKTIQFDDLGKELSLEWIINHINSNSKCLLKVLKFPFEIVALFSIVPPPDAANIYKVKLGNVERTLFGNFMLVSCSEDKYSVLNDFQNDMIFSQLNIESLGQ